MASCCYSAFIHSISWHLAQEVCLFSFVISFSMRSAKSSCCHSLYWNSKVQNRAIGFFEQEGCAVWGTTSFTDLLIYCIVRESAAQATTIERKAFIYWQVPSIFVCLHIVLLSSGHSRQNFQIQINLVFSL